MRRFIRQNAAPQDGLEERTGERGIPADVLRLVLMQGKNGRR
jgi:hypothetical protein